MEENFKFRVTLTNFFTQETELVEVLTANVSANEIEQMVYQTYHRIWTINKAVLIWSDDF